MTLVTRAPMGRPSWPLVLVEGPERSGKLAAVLALADDPRIGRVFVLDVTGHADEIAGLHEIIDTNGTYADLLDKVRLACAAETLEGRPNVVVVDGTELWELLRRWVDTRARRSTAVRKMLAEDPDAPIDTAQSLWIDAKDRWADVVNVLRRFPGIGVVVAASGEATAYVDGQPTGSTVWAIQAEKTITRAATVWVRVQAGSARLIAATARPDLADVDLPFEPMASVLFDMLGEFVPVAAHPPEVGVSAKDAKVWLLDEIKSVLGLGEDDAKLEAARLWKASGLSGFELSSDQVRELLATVGTPPAPEQPDEPDPDPVAVDRGEAG